MWSRSMGAESGSAYLLLRDVARLRLEEQGGLILRAQDRGSFCPGLNTVLIGFFSLPSTVDKGMTLIDLDDY